MESIGNSDVASRNSDLAKKMMIFDGKNMKTIATGIAKTKWEGRLQVVSQDPLIIVDGAHNPDKIRALVAAVKTIWSRKVAITVLAIKEDKNSDEMLKIFNPGRSLQSRVLHLVVEFSNSIKRQTNLNIGIWRLFGHCILII